MRRAAGRLTPGRGCGIVVGMKRLVVLVLLGAGAAWAVDYSGAWDADVDLDAGSGTAQFDWKQTGNKLAGTYSGALGEAKVTGTVTGDRIEWSFEATPEGGEAMKVTYRGKLAGDGSIQGECDYGPLGKGTFTAHKKDSSKQARTRPPEAYKRRKFTSIVA